MTGRKGLRASGGSRKWEEVGGIEGDGLGVVGEMSPRDEASLLHMLGQHPPPGFLQARCLGCPARAGVLQLALLWDSTSTHLHVTDAIRTQRGY